MSGNFHCTTKSSSSNCSRLCLPPQLPYDYHHFSWAACKIPFNPLVSFPGSWKRRDFSCRRGLEKIFSLAHRARIVNLTWYGALSLAMIPSLLSILARPSAHLRGMCEPMVSRGSGSRRNRVAWVCVQVKFAWGLPLHLSLEGLHPFFFVLVFSGTTGLAFCAVQSTRDCLKIQLPGVACVAKCSWLKTNNDCAG